MARDQGLTPMEEDQDLTNMGDQQQDQQGNPGNFAEDRDKARKAGKEGGQSSHGGGQS